jgi:hypothetical protein
LRAFRGNLSRCDVARVRLILFLRRQSVFLIADKRVRSTIIQAKRMRDGLHVVKACRR